MFESAELGHKIDKETYDGIVLELRADLLDAQFDAHLAGRFPIIILINGLDGAGKGETVNLLNEWMDPRHIETHAFGLPSDEERVRAPMWSFWRVLAPKGKIGIYFGNWYTEPIVGRARKLLKSSELDQRLTTINRFEKMLVDEGALIVKFWFHLSHKAQGKRLKALEADPRSRWRVTAGDWKRYEHYTEYREVAEHVLRETNMDYAPWHIIDSEDHRYRTLAVARTLLDRIRRRLDTDVAPTAAAPGSTSGSESGKRSAGQHTAPGIRIDAVNILNSLDLTRSIDKKEYEDSLEAWQGKLATLVRDPRFKERSLVVVFEGSDAAGKGGAIRRITGALDARQYRTIQIAAPSEEEKAQPYLWRFWRHAPPSGKIVIFDRSWYGRVLVERVEGFCPEADWMRAYAEINDFEAQWMAAGAVIVKFWLSISADEQLRRFQEREKTRFKRFKITDEDWRNREKWAEYERAVCDMVDRTSNEFAPWTLVEANDKKFARIKILKTICRKLEAIL